MHTRARAVAQEATSKGSKSTDSASTAPARKRKRNSRNSESKANGTVNGELINGGWDELPHNMGNVAGKALEGVNNEDGTAEIPVPAKRARKSGKPIKVEGETEVKEEPAVDDFGVGDAKAMPVAAKKSTDDKSKPTKRSAGARSTRGNAPKGAPVTPESSGTSEDPVETDIKEETSEAKPKRQRASRAKNLVKTGDVKDKVKDLVATADQDSNIPKKGKKNPYGLTPGQSPFPDFPMPTIEACEQVNSLLATMHGNVVAPKTIPAPSLEVSGCGEVPSILDALMRTLLSAATSGTNSSRAFQGLINRYGKLEEGIGKGSVNWYKVRESSLSDVFQAIKSGGLADTKSKRIKTILDMVYEQNMARREAFLKEKENLGTTGVAGIDTETQGQKDMEIAKADSNILSLDHLHALSAEDAMVELTKYPGIGVKTASCVLLFCMQRPSFAVDTHVWRLCKWLGWVPEGATRDQTFSHCEIRVPDHLKYPLHQLFIKHGKTCGRCRANTGLGSTDYIEAQCPIDHLVTRTGKRKGGSEDSKAKGPTKKGKSKAKHEEWDSDLEMEDEPDLESSNDELSELSEPEAATESE
jgi:endonuclease III